MTALYKKRFEELHQQMERLFASKSSTLDPILGKSRIDIDANALLEWKVKVRNLLSRACGVESEHYRNFGENEKPMMYGTSLVILERLRAVFVAAKEDFEGGYLQSVRALVQAEIFESELDQAKELFRGGYITAAAVIAGTVLETTLRELCVRNTIPVGPLDKMNADLAKHGTYNMLVQKRNTALANIRNSAAHGRANEFTTPDVDDMLRDVERFVREYLP